MYELTITDALYICHLSKHVQMCNSIMHVHHTCKDNTDMRRNHVTPYKYNIYYNSLLTI